MLKIAVASHIALDTIDNEEGYLGGAACYCGLTCRQLGFETTLVTKVGDDFPAYMRQLLEKKGLTIKQFEKYHTTRFQLKQHGYSRKLFLRAKCTPLTLEDVEHIDVDGWIVSPIIDEVPLEVLRMIASKNKFVMLDPQGYFRKVGQSGLISMQNKISLDIPGISAIRVNEDELSAVGRIDPEFLISTGTRIIRMNQYQIRLDHIEAKDSTGLGDIMTAAFTCAYLKEGDPKWSICFAAGATKAALENNSMGVNKVPTASQIEDNAYNFFKSI